MTRGAKDALVSALVNDANALVEALNVAELDERAAAALALLALVAGQDVEPAEGSDGTDGRWRIARKVAEDRVVSTVDPDARHTRKSPEARRDGYRAHMAADPQTGIITDEQLTKAAGQENSDPAVAAEFLAAEAAGNDTDAAGAAGHAGPDAAGSQDNDGDQDNDGEGDGGPGELAAGDHTGAAGAAGHADAAGSQDSDADQDNDGDGDGRLAWYGDSAYGTGDLRDAIGKAGHQAVIKPKPLQPPVEGGFTLDDFTVSDQDRTVTCPGGVTRPVTPSRNVTFGAACRHCPLRERCTKSKTGRTLILHEHDDLLRAARADWAARTGLREDYMKHRPNVERTVAQVATWRGRRIKLRYRGTAKNNAWLKRRTAALNLRNLIGRGLARHDGAWVLTT